MGSLDIPLEEVPVYIGDRLLIFTALFVPLQIFCVALRFISRYKVRTPWGLDDAVILFALAQQMGMAGISIGSWPGHPRLAYIRGADTCSRCC